MKLSALDYYRTNTLGNDFTYEDVLLGKIIKLNPALITLVDGRNMEQSITKLQALVQSQVRLLLEHDIRTFHVDINFADYGGFGSSTPCMTQAIFTPDWIAYLTDIANGYDAFINVHLLTDSVEQHLADYIDCGVGAFCF